MVTDEMVEKAERVYWDASNDPEGARDMRAALEAALSAAEPELTYQCDVCTTPGYGDAPCSPVCDRPKPSVAVKALKWRKYGNQHGTGWQGMGAIGYLQYIVDRGPDGEEGWFWGDRGFDTEDEAKAAVQADYDACIRSALSAQVQDVEVDRSTDIRKAGLKARDELLECMFDASTVDNDLAEYMERIIDACVRAAAPAKQEGGE